MGLSSSSKEIDMKYSITTDVLYSFYLERSKVSGKSQIVRAIFCLGILFVAAISAFLGQWLASILLVVFIAVFIGITLRHPKIIANSMSKGNAFRGDVVLEFSPEGLILKMGENVVQLYQEGILSSSETENFISIQHNIGLSFFVPKKELQESDLAKLRELSTRK